MTLSVIGAGFGRTGTTSVKAALEHLGFGPCYHMAEVRDHPEHVARWVDAIEGRPVDWDAHLAGYRSTLDWPACSFWAELAVHHPAAKVLLTVRDPDAWYESVMATGYKIMVRLQELADERGEVEPLNLLVHRGQLLDVFPDRDRAIDLFLRHNAVVTATVPPERLLVFDVAQGWEPLCEFLGVAVPDAPFPSRNDPREFWRAPPPRS